MEIPGGQERRLVIAFGRFVRHRWHAGQRLLESRVRRTQLCSACDPAADRQYRLLPLQQVQAERGNYPRCAPTSEECRKNWGHSQI